MTHTLRPVFDPADDLTDALDIDLNKVIAPLWAQREVSPISRPSFARDAEKLIDQSTPSHGGESLDDLVAQLSHAFNEYPRRNTHPGFFGWIAPSGVPTDPLAHAMLTAINGNIGGYIMSPIGHLIERAVVGWMAELCSFPEACEGVILSGGSLANLTAMASALAHKFGPDFRNKGLHAFCDPAPPVVLCSNAAHFSIRRAAATLGIGIDQCVAVETDDQFRMRPDDLERALSEHPNVACVIATAGTTNTGAIDPLNDIADVCERHGIWLHIDAAYGGGGMMSDQLKPRFAGIERADSITMDLHKWFFQSLDGSVLLYKDARAPRSLFYETSDYLHTAVEPKPEEYMFFHINPELSRRFRALPFYIALRHYGMDRLGRNALHNVRCAEYMAAQIEQHDKLELVSAPQLSILTYRFVVPGLSDDEIDSLNSAIRDQIQIDGDYMMSPTQVNGRPVLRVSIVNHATRAEHIDGLLEGVLRIGKNLTE
ncbi:MAG: aminotransferase class I/II-fold pyridoxal phosphate-dependent enzyme [Pseudomonadota bacterium]